MEDKIFWFFASGRGKDGLDSIDLELWTIFELKVGNWEPFEIFELGRTEEVNYAPNLPIWKKTPNELEF